MPRHYVDVRAAGADAPDHEGITLDGDEVACELALSTLADMVREQISPIRRRATG